MSSAKSPQSMKPATAAQKLGIYLDAAPAEFRDGGVTREELASLLESPPEWLVELRKNGPHPRLIVAGKLGVSSSGLARGGVTQPLTTAQIKELLAAPPEWLVRERGIQAAVREDQKRIKEAQVTKAKKAARTNS